jgi:hypothetical protein
MQVHSRQNHFRVLRPANLAQRLSVAVQKKKPEALVEERVRAQVRPRA